MPLRGVLLAAEHESSWWTNAPSTFEPEYTILPSSRIDPEDQMVPGGFHVFVADRVCNWLFSERHGLASVSFFAEEKVAYSAVDGEW